MAEDGVEGKETKGALASMSIYHARPVLGDLVIRASLNGERTVLTRNRKPSAAVVSMDDLERLIALDAERAA